jgi:hypothetical protein
MTSGIPSPRDSAGYVPWWLLAIVAAFLGIVALLLMGYALATRLADLPVSTATAIVVTAPPLAVPPTLAVGGPPTPTPEAVAPTSAPPPPPAGEIKIGGYVQVTGTGSDGVLNLRAEPGLDKPVNYVAIEREVLQVQAGPADADGFVWWYLVDPASNTKFGWGVQNYLQGVQGP